MAKTRTSFVCQQCGNRAVKWLGRCPDCRNWNSFVEQIEAPKSKRSAPALSKDHRPIALQDVSLEGGGEVRILTGIGELDNVLGGGLVAGSLVLVGGDPGVGKSTLVLMAMDRFARRGLPVLYVSGEESVRQIRLRADRLGVQGRDLHLLAHTDFSHIENIVRELNPCVVVIDSVQTVHVPNIDSIPGSISQIREVAHRAMLMSKSTNTSTFLIGHVTKSGDLAGPKVLEHFVDTVLYFEGDGRSELRILRTVKNRFGPSGELGLFEMVDNGLREVPDASARLLEERSADTPGTAVIATLEGSRPLLIELQALVGRPTPATPARTCVGIDRNRVLMLAAVLEKSGCKLHDRDLFVNAAGGVRLSEPAADMGVVAAIASSLTDIPVPSDVAVFGEVGLVGEVRAVSHPGLRLKEAARHGFRRVIVPSRCAADAPPGLNVIGVKTVSQALEILFSGP